MDLFPDNRSGRNMQSERYAFKAAWFNPSLNADLQLILFYYVTDGNIELYEVVKHRTFSRRTTYEDITLDDLYIGASVPICSRLIKITDYSDSFTADRMKILKERSVGIVKPVFLSDKTAILRMVLDDGLKIINIKTVMIDEMTVGQLLTDGIGNYGNASDEITCGISLVFEAIGERALEKLSDISRCKTRTCDAENRAPNGPPVGGAADAMYTSQNEENAARDSELFFSCGNVLKPVTVMENSTCCVIKPHAVREGKFVEIIDAIEKQGFDVAGINMCLLTVAQAEEFHQVYKTVVPEYPGIIREMSSGNCVALEIVSLQNINVAREFRSLVGPDDPEVGKVIRPGTLRAIFGKDKIQNAVHVTDLEQDAPLEVSFFFEFIP